MPMCTHDKSNYRQLTFTFTSMNNERYFHNQITNCFMISLHYSWWLFHKINQKSFKQDIGHKVRTISRFMDTMLKKKVVHLSTIHGKTFEIPLIFFQQENGNFYCKMKQFFLQYVITSLTGEKNPFPFYASYFYTKRSKWLGCPK